MTSPARHATGPAHQVPDPPMLTPRARAQDVPVDLGEADKAVAAGPDQGPAPLARGLPAPSDPRVVPVPSAQVVRTRADRPPTGTTRGSSADLRTTALTTRSVDAGSPGCVRSRRAGWPRRRAEPSAARAGVGTRAESGR